MRRLLLLAMAAGRVLLFAEASTFAPTPQSPPTPSPSTVPTPRPSNTFAPSRRPTRSPVPAPSTDYTWRPTPVPTVVPSFLPTPAPTPQCSYVAAFSSNGGADPDNLMATSGSRAAPVGAAGGRLLITVRRAVNLPETDGLGIDGGLVTGSADPYVRVTVPDGASAARTAKRDSTLEPVWDEELDVRRVTLLLVVKRPDPYVARHL